MSGAIASINWNPAEKTLRQFGWICLIGFPLLAWTFSGRPRTFVELAPWSPTLIAVALGAVAAIVGSVYPKSLKPVFVGLSLITFPIGLVVSEIFLGTIFFLLFGFVSLIFRLVGFDPMTRTIDRSAQSYWTPKPQPASPKQYFKQY